MNDDVMKQLAQVDREYEKQRTALLELASKQRAERAALEEQIQQSQFADEERKAREEAGLAWKNRQAEYVAHFNDLAQQNDDMHAEIEIFMTQFANLINRSRELANQTKMAFDQFATESLRRAQETGSHVNGRAAAYQILSANNVVGRISALKIPHQLRDYLYSPSEGISQW